MKLPVHLEHEGLVSHRLGPGRNRLQIRSVATVRWRGVAVLHGFVAIRIFRHKRKSEVNRRSSLLAALNHKMEMNIWTASPTRLKSRSRPIFDYRKVTHVGIADFCADRKTVPRQCLLDAILPH
jgi:hypothetical protein